MVLSAFELENKWFQTGLADLKKHQTPEFLLINDFYDFKKNKSILSTFSDIFENNQLQILISLYAFYFM